MLVMTSAKPTLDQTFGNGPLTGTILVVDDSADSRQAMIDVLELEGFATLAVEDGPGALRLIDEQPPDLVLLDVMMDGMSGIEVLQAIRSRPETAETPVLMVTVLDRPEDVVNGLELGANDYLIKPVQGEILVARVRTQLKLKRLQDQRRQDLIRLAELDTLKDRFVQIAAHDLKNPISNISLSLDLLEPSAEQIAEIVPDFLEIAKVMRLAANTMMVIVNDFLDHHAIRSGQMRIARQPTSLNDVIIQTVDQFRPTAEQKGIALSVEIDPALDEIQADPNRLMQIASNLISNGLKFTPRGGSVTVRTLAGKGAQRVEVSDTGPGIAEDEMPLLFQEFTRLRNRPTGGEKSSGLGLSIAKQLVELHGGQIGADSKRGKGSTFWFELPE